MFRPILLPFLHTVFSKLLIITIPFLKIVQNLPDKNLQDISLLVIITDEVQSNF